MGCYRSRCSFNRGAVAGAKRHCAGALERGFKAADPTEFAARAVSHHGYPRDLPDNLGAATVYPAGMGAQNHDVVSSDRPIRADFVGVGLT